MSGKQDILVLFDVDGTLTPARKSATPEVLEILKKLRTKATIGFVGGSDLPKQVEQLGENVLNMFDYCFAENGLTAYKNAQPLASQSFIQFIGEEKYQQLVNFILRYIADLKIPQKRGTFIEFRNGMINVSPIGRNCSYEERLAFEKYDLINHVRSRFVKVLQEQFSDYGLTYSIGGQISFDVFPNGWDKTYWYLHFYIHLVYDMWNTRGLRRFTFLVIKRPRVGMIMRYLQMQESRDIL